MKKVHIKRIIPQFDLEGSNHLISSAEINFGGDERKLRIVR